MFSLSDSDLTREQKEYLQGILQEGETLLWAGIPKRKLPFSAWVGSIPAAIFACIWGGLVFGNGFGQFLVKAVQSGDNLLPALIAIPFLLIPFIILCAAVGSPLWTLCRMGRTLYAVTDRRYLAAVNYPRVGRRLQEWSNAPYEIITHQDGSGDVVLGYRTVHHKGGSVSRTPLGLLSIPNMERVKPLIEQRAAVARSEEEWWEDDLASKSSEANPLIVRILGCVFLIGAACALFFAVKNAYGTHNTLAGMAEAEGVVTHLESQISHGRRSSGRTYCAHYRFTVDGKTYHGKQNAFSNPPSYEKGEKLTVLYNPADPQDSCTSSFVDNYIGAVIAGFLGVFFSVFGSVMLLGRRGKNRANGDTAPGDDDPGDDGDGDDGDGD